VAHAYANQALGQRTEAGFLTLPGRGRIGGGFDWAGYLGALEEVDYRGYLTIWPDPAGDPVRQFRDLRTTLETF
jgi:sugar phosphate isomerase/epimerase